jgi:hypothetical protein
VFEFLRIIFAIVAIFAIFAVLFFVLFLFLSFCLIHIVHVFTKYLCDVSIIDDVFLVLPLSHTLCIFFFSPSPSLSSSLPLSLHRCGAECARTVHHQRGQHVSHARVLGDCVLCCSMLRCNVLHCTLLYCVAVYCILSSAVVPYWM